MKLCCVLAGLALATPIVASPRPHQSYSYSSSYSDYDSDSWSSSWRPRRHHATSKWGTYQTSTYSDSYPTLSPSGGYRGSQTGYGGKGPESQPTGQPTGLPTGQPTGNPSSPGPSSGNSSLTGGGPLNVPSGCLHKGNVAVGWLPGPDEKIGDMNSKLGSVACFDGEYAQITSGGAYSDSSMQLTPSIAQLTGGKTVFIASVMPSIPFSQVDSTVAGGVASVLKKFTDQGIEVWLRFAHEMNWYVTDGTYHGTASEFQTAWGTMSSAVESNSQIKMFWSPNEASSGDLQQWFPTQGKVDMVGIDIYPKQQQSFGSTYGDFCKTFSTAKNLPFVIGETGAGPDLKQAWFSQVLAGDSSACPQYVGFSWFDYNKEADFRVVDGSNIAQQALGSGGS